MKINEITRDVYKYVYVEEMDKMGNKVPEFNDLPTNIKQIWYKVGEFYQKHSINNAVCLASIVKSKLNQKLDTITSEIHEVMSDYIDDMDN